MSTDGIFSEFVNKYSDDKDQQHHYLSEVSLNVTKEDEAIQRGLIRKREKHLEHIIVDSYVDVYVEDKSKSNWNLLKIIGNKKLPLNN